MNRYDIALGKKYGKFGKPPDLKLDVQCPVCDKPVFGFKPVESKNKTVYTCYTCGYIGTAVKK